VLPVSLIEFPDDEAAFAGADDDEGEPELLHAATMAASGMRTAAASGREILLITEDRSFGFSRTPACALGLVWVVVRAAVSRSGR
jgi:hypothetical protein